jgi:acyl carrier protein
VNQSGVSDGHVIDSVALAALTSMAAVDGPIGRDALLVDIEIDSLDLVELTQILEEECDVTVSVNAFADAATVGDVIDVARSHTA